MLLTRTTQPMYDAAREANGPDEVVVVSDEVGQMTRSIGKSFVQEDTSNAVEIALGDASPGRGLVCKSGALGGLEPVVGDVRSLEICRECTAALSLAVAVACDEVLDRLVELASLLTRRDVPRNRRASVLTVKC